MTKVVSFTITNSRFVVVAVRESFLRSPVIAISPAPDRPLPNDVPLKTHRFQFVTSDGKPIADHRQAHVFDRPASSSNGTKKSVATTNFNGMKSRNKVSAASASFFNTDIVFFFFYPMDEISFA